MKRLLVVVDMQTDFLTGALKNDDAIKIVPYVKEKIEKAKANGDIIVFTRDTHDKDYLKTEEGKNLPVEHCIRDTKGWNIIKELDAEKDATAIFDKLTFGSNLLADFIKGDGNIRMLAGVKPEVKFDEIEFIGVCTDICVISNAMIAKTFAPNAHVVVDAAGCAGITPESHDNALNAMKMCHVEVKNQGEEAWRK